jgi:crossover junction endodeoxyribonuclease RusA
VKLNRKTGKRVVHRYMTNAGKTYQQEVWAASFGKGRVDGRVGVRISLYPPDHAKRDIDNFVKVLLDGLTKAGVWEDDEQIDLLTIARQRVSPPDGWCSVEVVSLGA